MNRRNVECRKRAAIHLRGWLPGLCPFRLVFVTNTRKFSHTHDISLHRVFAQGFHDFHAQREFLFLDRVDQRLRSAAQTEIVFLRGQPADRVLGGQLVHRGYERAHGGGRVNCVAGNNIVDFCLMNQSGRFAPFAADEFAAWSEEENGGNYRSIAEMLAFKTMVGMVAFWRESMLRSWKYTRAPLRRKREPGSPWPQPSSTTVVEEETVRFCFSMKRIRSRQPCQMR